MGNNEFQEIPHSGGKFTITRTTDVKGKRFVQFGFIHTRPTPLLVFGIYVLPQGIPVGMIEMGGIGQPWNKPPVEKCFPAFIASDNHGMCGHLCPKCKGRMKSMGKNAGYRCPKCRVKVGEEKVKSSKVKRELATGLYEVPVCARRHLAKPIKRKERRKIKWINGNALYAVGFMTLKQVCPRRI